MINKSIYLLNYCINLYIMYNYCKIDYKLLKYYGINCQTTKLETDIEATYTDFENMLNATVASNTVKPK